MREKLNQPQVKGAPAETRSLRARFGWALPLALIPIALLGSSQAFPQVEEGISRKQDGLSIFVHVERQELVAQWRFTQPIAPPLDEVTATFNSRPLGTPKLEAYPQEDARTQVLLLLDVSDAKPEEEILRDKLYLLSIVDQARPHHQVQIAVYSDMPRFLLAANHDVRFLLRMLADARGRVISPELGRVLESIMEVLAHTSTERRGIFVVTDGHTDGALDVGRVIEQARRWDVALNFIVIPSKRKAHVADLASIASGSGGVLVQAADVARFLQAPFALLDSGARARFP